jgi:hypothetical protein
MDLDDWQSLGSERLRSAKFADFKIVCRDKTFDVPKVVLAEASEYFRACLDNSLQEGVQGQLTLDEDPLKVAAVLFGCYAGASGPMRHSSL